MLKSLLTALILSVSFSFPCLAVPWEFSIKNDFVIPGGLDRFLSNAFYIGVGDYSIGNEMYTPTDKRSFESTGDRPYDGYSYLQYRKVSPLAFGQELVIKSRLGVVGEASGSEALQKFIHNDLGAGVDPTWANQNPSEPAVDFLVSKLTREYVQSILGDTKLTQEFGARAGTVNNSLFLDQEIRKGFFKYVHFYAGLRGDVVFYNTFLDGRMFQSNKYTVEKNWFVASGRAGIELYFPRWNDFFINYGYTYITEEFETQKGRHAYGALSFGTKF
jgi:hypothetical protein